MSSEGRTATPPPERETWVVIHRATGNIVAEYQTCEEADEAAEWYMGTWPHGGKLEVQRAS